jgi:hypothetical protein
MLFEAATHGLLMSEILKTSHNEGKKYLQNTTCKLFHPETFGILHHLMLDRLPHGKAAMEMSKHLKVIEIDQGEQIPVRKECMFMML